MRLRSISMLLTGKHKRHTVANAISYKLMEGFKMQKLLKKIGTLIAVRKGLQLGHIDQSGKVVW